MSNREPSTVDLLQARPQRATQCMIERQHGAAQGYVLKDAAGMRYMLLSEEGLFVWQLIDGERSIGELCRAYLGRCERATPEELMRALARFCESGFVQLQDQEPGEEPRGCFARARGLCTRYYWVPEIDGWVTALYRFVRMLYTRPSQGVLLVVALVGLAAFARHLVGGAAPTAGVGTLPALIAGFALQVLAHEAAHAATAKHFGAQVRRAGIGWYFLAPVAFVDTSDIWAAARFPRVLVSAAGPYSNLVLSGIAGLCAALLPSGALAGSLWSVAAMGYALACINMNPLLELDGYYIVMDLLEVPNLRARALACLGDLFRQRRPAAGDRRLRLVLMLFGAASVIYGVAMAVGIVLVCHANIASLAGASLPSAGQQAIGWAGAGLVGLLLLTKLVGELQRA